MPIKHIDLILCIDMIQYIWLVGMFGILFSTGRLLTVMNAFKIGSKIVVGIDV